MNFGTDENGLTKACLIFNKMGIEASDASEMTKSNKIILKLLNDEQKWLECLQKDEEKKEELALEVKLASLALPSKEAMDKILRYETTIERQLYRAMNQLEQLTKAESW